MNKTFYSKLKYFIGKGKDISFMAKSFGMTETKLIKIIEDFLKVDRHYKIVDGLVVPVSNINEPEDIYYIENKSSHIKLLLTSDFHLCSSYDRVDCLEYLADKADGLGVFAVFISGDFTEGIYADPIKNEEVKITSYSGQIDYCVSEYPVFSCNSYVADGNHEEKWNNLFGFQFLQDISRIRKDIIYLGGKSANIQIGNLKIHLYHGDGRNVYSNTYPVKYLDRMSLDFVPDILQTGHIHQSYYGHKGSTCVFQTGALQDLTPYAKEKGMEDEKSVWWVDVYFDDKGKVREIKRELEIVTLKR